VQEVFSKLAVIGRKLQRPCKQALIALNKEVFVAALGLLPELKHGSNYKTFGWD
jgi:hypothetical protein